MLENSRLRVFLVSAFILLSLSACGQNAQKGVSQEGDTIIIRRGDNYVELQKVQAIDQEYRVMGVATLDGGNNSLNHIKTILPLVPLDDVRQVWRQDNCERRAFEALVNTPIIIIDPAVEKKFNSCMAKKSQYKHFALHIKGAILQKVKHLFAGKETSMQGPFDMNRSLLVEEVEIVDW